MFSRTKLFISSIHLISKSFYFLSQVIIFLIMLTTCYDVFMRYIFSKPTNWSIEIGALSLVFIAFLAGAELTRNNHHIQMDLIFNRLKPRGQKYVDLFLFVVAILFCLVLFWVSSKTTLIVYKTGILTGGAFRIPIWMYYIVVPLGSLIMALENVAKIVSSFQPKG